ncbi:MAG: S8 family serine peptidase [Hyphomicrobium sp.]
MPGAQDPGGIAVALIGPGVDYTRVELASRLARDGEGELIGWDFIDNDRRPFKANDDLEAMGYTDRGTAMALTLHKRAKTARIAPVRIEPGEEESVQKGVGMAAMTPAKVAVLWLEHSRGALWAALHTVMADAKPKFLLIVAAGEDENDRDRIKEHLAPDLDTLDTVLVVTACDRNGEALTTAEGAATTAEVAVNTEAFTAELLTTTSFSWKPEASIAAAEIGALAARLLAAEPALGPADLKSRILSLATPYAGNQLAIAQKGWIGEPWRHAAVR